MNRTILAVATILAATGGAFAGSDNHRSTGAGQPSAAVDATYTASVVKPAMAGHEMAAKTAAEEPGPRFWGR